MINLVRSGPRQIIIETNHPDFTLEALKSHYKVIMTIKNTSDQYRDQYHKLTQLAEEKQVILHLTAKLDPLMRVTDFNHSVLVEEEMDVVLVEIINQMSVFKINKARLSPKLIIMKWVGDFSKYLAAVLEDVEGHLEDKDQIFDNHAVGTFIAFTKASINTPVAYSDVASDVIYAKEKYSSLIKRLRTHNLKYINASLDHSDWYELKIKIYDSFGHYSLHYKRMMYVLDKLDYGLVLGEAWGTDTPNVFYKVGVYKVRLFTFLDPILIKQVLVGLEYLDSGMRVVDLDLYHKRKKIRWDDLRTKTRQSKSEIVSHFRKELLNALSDKEKEELAFYDLEVIASRSKR